MEISSCAFKNTTGLSLKNYWIQIIVLPQQGAKIASIVYRPTMHEVLWQNPDNNEFTFSRYGTPFSQGDVSGIDDMFPSISACRYQKRPWEGLMIPDHGEVWALEWDYRILLDAIEFSTSGRALPYILNKRLTLYKNEIHFIYKLTNTGKEDIDFIWAFHPLFQAVEGMEVILPDTVEEIVNVYDENDVMGAYGLIYPWPQFIDARGSFMDLARVPTKDTGICVKYYIKGNHQGFCGFRDHKNRLQITLTYPEDVVGFTGIWMDCMGYKEKPQYNIALEPSIGGYDSLAYAQQHDTCGKIPASKSLSWYLHIRLDQL